MRFSGSPKFVEFWDLLKDESPRGRVIVAAAYFDERLGSLVSRPGGSFDARIRQACAMGVLTANEYADLHSIRSLRNDFAHDLRANSFDASKSQVVENFNTWQIASHHLSRYLQMFPRAEDRFLYVVGILYVRLELRTPIHNAVPPEPPFTDLKSWPAIREE